MIRAIIVDDEPLALQLMEKKLTDLGTVEVVKSFSMVSNVLKEMKQLNFQVAFLDIEMPGLNGLDLAELIQEWNSDIHIVFVTASKNYAIQAFELHSIDYLVKPIMSERLKKTISRIQDQLQTNKQDPQQQKESSAIEVICFSEFAVYHNRELVKWKTAKVQELFAFFVTHLNTYVNRDSLIEFLWPDNDYQKAKIQLHTSISYLRKTLKTLGYSKVLSFSNQSYILELPDFTCDAILFERMITDLKTVNSTNIEELERTVQLYSGSYLEKNGYEWAMIQAQSLKHQLLQVLQVLQKMIDYYDEHEMHDEKSQYIQLLLSHNPYSEHALQQLMHHFINTGNRADAVKFYQDFKELLMEDLGISPDRVTNKIYDLVLKGE